MQGTPGPARDLTRHGRIRPAHCSQEKGHVVFGKKEAKQCLAALDHQRRLLMKINDKGGVVVVADGKALLTIYNCSQHH